MPCKVQPNIYWRKPNAIRDRCVAVLTFLHLRILQNFLPFLTIQFNFSRDFCDEIREFSYQIINLVTEALTRKQGPEPCAPSTSFAGQAGKVGGDTNRLPKTKKESLTYVEVDDFCDFEKFVRDIEILLIEDLPDNRQVPRPVPLCHYCHIFGHTAKNCPKLKKKKCYRCGNAGHLIRFCKQRLHN